jgi:hypothetical protein
VQQPKELYDVVVSYTSSGVREVIPPVRYPNSGQLTVIAPGGNIAAAAANDNTIVFLQPGNYPGNFEIPARTVLIFGACSLRRRDVQRLGRAVHAFGHGLQHGGAVLHQRLQHDLLDARRLPLRRRRLFKVRSKRTVTSGCYQRKRTGLGGA